jgi:UDPglucose 6-dehydrogenase
MKIAVIGTGYIGLVSGVCFASIGHTVTCVDNNASKIDALNQGEIPIFEPGLAELLAKARGLELIKFTTDVVEATRQNDAVFIAVGTPTAADGMSSDLQFVFSVAREIARGIDQFKVVVTKSTVPVGTGRRIASVIAEANPSASFEVASNPEFLREGAAIFDFMNPDRIVLGAQTPRGVAILRDIYAPLNSGSVPIIETELETAELIKFASNGFLATKIAFINEIAALCEKTGADVQIVARGMGLDDRIGPKFLNAGPGFGGSCFPKDTRALAAMGRANNVDLGIIEAVVSGNENTKLRMVEKISALAGGDLKGQTLAILGVTFKPDTDDMREAPSLSIVPALLAKGASIRVTDPEGRKHGEALLPGVTWTKDAYEAVHGADMVVVLTEWKDYRVLDLKALAAKMRKPRMADLRNIYKLDALQHAGFTAVTQIGRKS